MQRETFAFAAIAANACEELSVGRYEFPHTRKLGEALREVIRAWGDPGSPRGCDIALRSALRASGYVSEGSSAPDAVLGMLEDLRKFLVFPWDPSERSRLAYFSWTLAAHAALGSERIARLRRRQRT